MKRTIFILSIIVVACIGGVLGSFLTLFVINSDNTYTSIRDRQKLVLTNYSADTSFKVDIPKEFDFLAAAKHVTASVVHIRTFYGGGSFSINPLRMYMDGAARSSGSGVIISDDGYIATNNHVVEDATSIEVVMNNNQRFYAKVIGSDPSTDLALLKVDAKDLPFVKYGNSDLISPGEWVLAIGNPFDLNSTVTAGIISAKARNIGILRDKNNLQVESFIQTDAAVNPGNSGGALVNLHGELIGINTAIATSSGSYQGYSFAIPVSLVSKVMDDLLEFGQVQRGLLGVQIQDLNANIAEELQLDFSQGVLVTRVNGGSAAEEAGLLARDVIMGINGHAVNSVSELQEWVARNRPGTKIKVAYLRNGTVYEVDALLKNSEGKIEILSKETLYDLGGARFQEVTYKELNNLQIEGGVKVVQLNEGPWQKSNMKEGFIITHIDKISVENVKDLNRILEFKSGAILIEGMYENGDKEVYGVEW